MLITIPDTKFNFWPFPSFFIFNCSANFLKNIIDLAQFLFHHLPTHIKREIQMEVEKRKRGEKMVTDKKMAEEKVNLKHRILWH